jgi:2-desacetyl-2-hydroxyethyl bacteriochlorophyllide A dehydrogenase
MDRRMKAIIYPKYGPAEVMQLAERPIPEPGKDEVLVKIEAAALNPIDYVIRSGHMWPVTGFRFPKIPGSDFAGGIKKIGAEVINFQIGELVYGFSPTVLGGACAEYVVVKAKAIAPMPAGLNFQEAAALPLAALTAMQAMRDLAQMQAGQSVFLHGASGGVGQLAIQIAKVMGLKVSASCSFRNIEMLKSLGADEVIDYTQNDIRKLGRTFDLFFDVYGNMPLGKVWHQINASGVHVSTIPSPLNFLQQVNPFAKRRNRVVVVQSRREDLLLLKNWVENGAVKPIIDRVYPLEEVVAAHHYQESKRARGKVILQVTPV